MQTSTSSVRSKLACRTGSTPSTPGTLIARWRWPWTLYAFPTLTRASQHLSGGEKRRVALCQLLLSKPDLLLLDEPTNHLDAETVGWLERHLAEYPGCVIAVTHDRYFLDNVAEWILELDHGSAIPFQGNYSGWLEQKTERLRKEEKAESKRQRTLKQELEWIRSSPKARQAKQKARITGYEELVAQAKDARRATGAKIRIPMTKRLGDVVVAAEGLTKGFGEKLLIDDFEFNLPRGGIVGIIGANGAGKTTLFKMITGLEQPDAGALRVGETVDLAYVDQSRDALDDGKSVWEEISGGHDIVNIDGHEMNSRAYVSAFNFTGTDQQQKVGTLSGGERNRVHLAKLLKSGGNLMLLDEPTNDLDVETSATSRMPPDLPRMRGGHQSRPLLPGPHRDPHLGLRGQLRGRVVRG